MLHFKKYQLMKTKVQNIYQHIRFSWNHSFLDRYMHHEGFYGRCGRISLSQMSQQKRYKTWACKNHLLKVLCNAQACCTHIWSTFLKEILSMFCLLVCLIFRTLDWITSPVNIPLHSFLLHGTSMDFGKVVVKYFLFCL